jgi:hypothetical protein
MKSKPRSRKKTKEMISSSPIEANQTGLREPG